LKGEDSGLKWSLGRLRTLAGAHPAHSRNLVGRDSVEPFRSLKFSVSGLKREPGLNLES